MTESSELLEEYPPIRVTDRISIPHWKFVAAIAHHLLLGIISVAFFLAVGVMLVIDVMRMVAEAWTR